MTWNPRGKRFRRLLPALVGTAILIVLILYLGGVFRTGRVGADDGVAAVYPAVAGRETAQVRRLSLPQRHAAVGTVQSRSVIHIEAQVTARVEAVHVRSGEQVAAGAPLLDLDRRSLEARERQARQGLSAARHERSAAASRIDGAAARLEQAQAQYERIRRFVEVEAATRQQLEEAEAAWRQAWAERDQAVEGQRQAEARVELARRQLEEAEVGLGYANISAPHAAQVVRRLVEPGDLAMPGKPLLTLQSEEALRLEALVPEGLIGRLARGEEALLEIAGSRHEGRVEEIVPAADPQARSFAVKVAFPPAPGIFPGMFGRLLIPIDERPAVLVPRRAVLRVGQLELVKVVQEDDTVRSVLVTTGRPLDDEVEILSGLSGGERVVLGDPRHE